MKKHKITSYQKLYKSQAKTRNGTGMQSRDLNLKWFRKYDRLIDQSYGFLIRNGLSVANVRFSLTQ